MAGRKKHKEGERETETERQTGEEEVFKVQ